jgi:uncharacterized protein YceH (UPF0502 family)
MSAAELEERIVKLESEVFSLRKRIRKLEQQAK